MNEQPEHSGDTLIITTETMEDRLLRLEGAMMPAIMMNALMQNNKEVRDAAISVLNEANRVTQSANETPLENRIQKVEAQVGRIFDRLDAIQTWIVQLQDAATLNSEEEIEP